MEGAMHSGTGVIRTGDVSLSEYFREQLAIHAQELEPQPKEDTRWYLGNLLVRFCRSQDFFAFEDSRSTLRPLALLYSDALEARNEYERCQLLQQLGDLSLFLGALFPQHYIRRGLRQDYLVGMGCGAYDYLADNARQGRHVFSELSGAFGMMLVLVANACSADRETMSDDRLTLDDRLQRVNDARASRRLDLAGSVPTEDDRLH
jgi:hypothetical protein